MRTTKEKFFIDYVPLVSYEIPKYNDYMECPFNGWLNEAIRTISNGTGYG